MASLEALRADLQAAVEASAQVTCYEYLPERIVPPVAVIAASSPYITTDESNVYGEHTVQFRVDLVTATQANSMRTDALDALIEATYAGLIAEGWLVGDVTQPYGLQANNATYLAATIEVATQNKF